MARLGFERLETRALLASFGSWYLGAATKSVGESEGNVQIAVYFDRTINGTASVQWSTKGLTAQAGADFTDSSGSFTASSHTEGRIGTISVPIRHDTLSERSETFRVELQDPEMATLASPFVCTVTITDDDLPIANPDLYMVAEDTLLTASTSVLANDVSDPPLTAFVLSLPASGSLSFGADGYFSYAPAAEFSGAVSFNYSAGWWTGSAWIYSAQTTVTIQVNAVNDAPVLAAIGNKAVNEETPLSFVAGATDVDGPMPLVYSLLGAPVGASIGMTTGIFSWTPTEAQGPGNYTFTVLVNDLAQPTLSDGESITVTVYEANRAPTDLALSPTAVAENLPAGTVVGAFSSVDPDVPAGPFTYSLVPGTGSADNASFVLTAAGTLQTAAVFDYETKNSYAIRVRTTDPTGLWLEKAFTITVGDVLATPTALTLSSSTVAENSPIGTVVGTFSAVDPEPPAVPFSYGLVAGTGSADNAAFTIVGSELRTAASLDFETKNSYAIRVRTTDPGGLWLEKEFAIGITNIRETPEEWRVISVDLVSTADPALVPLTGDAASEEPSISSDGRYVAFASYAANLVSGDVNGQRDIFIRDRLSGTTTRVSTDSLGGESNGYCSHPSLSGNGRYVAFESRATNLVSDDTNGAGDVFVKDLLTGTTTRVSTDSTGGQADGSSADPCFSNDGQHVAFSSYATNLVSGDTNAITDVFVKNLATGTTTRASTDSAGSQSNDICSTPSISRDGRYVAFASAATNLIGSDTNARTDVFVKDMVTGTTTRVSTNIAGGGGSGHSGSPSISDDGRYVAFESLATNLINVDNNQQCDVFVRDMTTGTTTRVSTDSNGGEDYNSPSTAPDISGDGRYVAFESWGRLVSGDTNGCRDIFVKDLATGITTRVSTDDAGNQGITTSLDAAISDDGRCVAFQSYAENLMSGDFNTWCDVFVKDRTTGTTTSASLHDPEVDCRGGNLASLESGISSDGRHVAFRSWATNLVSGTANDDAPDVFFRDMASGTTTPVSTDSEGTSISNDGRYVAFTNGWCYVKDQITGTTTLVSTDNAGVPSYSYAVAPAISGDGRLVAFCSNATNLVSGNSNGMWHIFVKDLASGATTRVSTDSWGNQGNGESGALQGRGGVGADISGDGRYVAFQSMASNLVEGDNNGRQDIFLKDRVTGMTTLISSDSLGTPGNRHSWLPSISDDGRFVVFSSDASNLVIGDTNERIDVFVKDRVTGTTTRVSTDSGGNEGNFGASQWPDAPSISGDGRYVVFSSHSSNLVNGDTNGQDDVFVKDRVTGTTMRVSMSSAGGQANAASYYPSISGDGRYVVFASTASNLHPNAPNGTGDIFRVTLDLTSPAATLSSISTPRTQPVGSEGITFTEPVTGLDIGDLVLTRDASPVALTAGMLSGSGANYSLDLSTATTLDGTYSLTLSAPGGIADMAGNRLAAGQTVSWVMNTTPAAAADAYQVPEDGSLPIAAPGLLANDSAPGGGSLIAVLRSGPSHGSLTLFADGSFLYAPQHDYHGPDNFTYAARNAGGIDSNVASVSITVTPVTDVSGRHVFYNHSAWDGNDAGATVADYNAIAPLPDRTGHGHAGELDEPAKELGKQALLPGQMASFVHYTSYAKGINGILVVFDDLPDPQSLAATDFLFRVGNDDAPATWSAAPAPLAIRVDEDVEHPSFTGHPDVVTITWADEDPYTTPREAGAISNQWLQVTVLAGARTGLVADDVFYFGNQIGESGNSASDTNVDQNDEIGARNHPHTAFNAASLGDPYDFNRDGKVDQNDEILTRNNSASAFTRLQLIAASSLLQAASAAAGGSPLGDTLTPDVLAPVIAEATWRWSAAGLDPAQLKLLEDSHRRPDFQSGPAWPTVGRISNPAQPQFVVASLPGRRLGEASPQSHTVYLDDDAAGFGWFIDPSPAEDEEFTIVLGSTKAAVLDGPNHGKVELLTVVMHEMGHLLGRPDIEAMCDDLMCDHLAPGIRRIPKVQV